jgi:argininosuccinate lyase
MMTKGQPLAYNKDNQEDKEPLFDTIDTVHGSLKGMSAVIESMTIHRDKMAQALRQGYATATDLADYLVKKNIPFRDAHEMVGKIVHLAIDQKLPLDQLDLKVMQQVCRDIDEKVFQVLQPQGSVESRNIVGGTAPEQVKQAVNQARELIKRKR